VDLEQQQQQQQQQQVQTRQLLSFKMSTSTAEAMRAERHELGVEHWAWWAHVGDHVYVTPAAGNLSQRVGDYYAAMGSESALSDDMRKSRVGGDGRWHIFHLPQGPSALVFNRRGDRRSAFSRLVQLRAGDVMPAAFPHYGPAVCTGSVDSRLDQKEKWAAESITSDTYLAILKKIVNLKDDSGVITRSWSNPSGSKNALAFLQKEFSSMGLKNCLQKFSAHGRYQSNVVAVIPGTGAESLTLGAHYDSRPFSGAAPGAEDNGSGLAALLSVAKAYASQGIRPVKTLYFVGFAGEEPGLLGSDFFAEQLKANVPLPKECGAGVPTSNFLQKHKPGARRPHEAEVEDNDGELSFLQLDEAQLDGRSSAAYPSRKQRFVHQAIALDEVGWVTSKYDKHTINLESYDWTPVIMDQLACSSRRHNGDSLEVVHSSNPFGSDHMSFLEREMAAVLVINGDDEAYPNYHQSTDTIDNVNPEYAAKISRMVLGATMRIAGKAA